MLLSFFLFTNFIFTLLSIQLQHSKMILSIVFRNIFATFLYHKITINSRKRKSPTVIAGDFLKEKKKLEVKNTVTQSYQSLGLLLQYHTLFALSIPFFIFLANIYSYFLLLLLVALVNFVLLEHYIVHIIVNRFVLEHFTSKIFQFLVNLANKLIL